MNLHDVERSMLSSGKAEMKLHLNSKPLSRMQAMKAKCFECMNGFLDGRQDCKIKDCPLYPWMPYSDENRGSD